MKDKFLIDTNEIVSELKNSKYGIVAINKPYTPADVAYKGYVDVLIRMSEDKLYQELKVNPFTLVDVQNNMIIYFLYYPNLQDVYDKCDKDNNVYIENNCYDNSKDIGDNKIKRLMLSKCRAATFDMLFSVFNNLGLNKHHSTNPYNSKDFKKFESEIKGLDFGKTLYIAVRRK